MRVKEEIEILYKNTHLYLDKNFKQKFQKEFSSRLWEMYLIHTLLEQGFKIKKQKTDRGPDIKILLDNGKILWIEAVVANRGKGVNHVKEIPLGPSCGHIDDCDFPKILRLTNSISYKYRKYFTKSSDDYVSNSNIEDDDLYMIAICPEFEDFDERCILNTLFSIGKAIYTKDMESPFYEKREVVPKSKDLLIDVGIFESNKFPRLNGVIYSNSRTIDVLHNGITEESLYLGFNPKSSIVLKDYFNFGFHMYKDKTVKIRKIL
ncbi:hypothetical protein COB57_02760 [Candidatus Peregrinibacteria bacterium]|nr:MAG: hypothetical protein COB57_02760 [Candidatus Peregrinibacteria bacterium]